MKKLLVLIGMLAIVPCAHASIGVSENSQSPDITVKDTGSCEFLRNQGYSTEIYRINEIRSRNPLTPIPVEEKRQSPFVSGLKKVGWQFLEDLDPTIDHSNFAEHDIRYGGVTVDDL